MRAAGQHLDQKRKQDDRRGIVQQALALEEPGQPRRCADLAKDRHHRRRIGGRDNGAEQQSYGERNPGKVEAEADRRGGREDREDGERKDRRGVLRDLSHIDGERGMKQEKRQKHDQEDRGADRQVDNGRDNIVENADQRRVKQKR